MKLLLPNYYVIHYIINDAEKQLSDCWWSQTAYHRWYSHVVFCSHRCLWVVYTVACIVFFEWWPAMFFCAKYIWLGVFTRYHWAGCIFADNPSDVFFGADTALYFLRAESCMNVFFWCETFVSVFFDGETCVSVFFRTFELFDAMHAIHWAGRP